MKSDLQLILPIGEATSIKSRPSSDATGVSPCTVTSFLEVDSSHLRFDIYEISIANRETSVDRRILEGARSCLIFKLSGNHI